MKHLDILLIEDNIEDSLWVEIQLKKAGPRSYSLQTCEYFAKAIQLVEAHKFSLIVLDLCLPDSQGMDSIKTLVKTSNIPVIIYTGISNQLIREEALKIGISGYLIKGMTSAEDLNRSIMESLREVHS